MSFIIWETLEEVKIMESGKDWVVYNRDKNTITLIVEVKDKQLTEEYKNTVKNVNDIIRFFPSWVKKQFKEKIKHTKEEIIANSIFKLTTIK